MPRGQEQVAKVKLIKDQHSRVRKNNNSNKVKFTTSSKANLIKNELASIDTSEDEDFTTNSPAVMVMDNIEQSKEFILKFEGEKIKEYQDPLKLFKEIKRCKPNAKVSNAYVSRFNYSLTIIAENEATFKDLQKPWKHDAFGTGIAKKELKKQKHFIAIKGVHPSINVEDYDFINELNKANVLNPKRITKKSTNIALPLIKAEVHNIETFNGLIKESRIKIGFTIYQCAKWEFNSKPLQCFKCNGFGHSSVNCSIGNRCLICADTHDYKVCLYKDN